MVTTDEREPCADRNELKNLYWGDLHVHTSLSWDAVLEGVNTTQEEAYAFAKGDPVTVAGATVQLDRPLDFAALTDHAEFLAEVTACIHEDGAMAGDPWCVEFREGGTNSVQVLGIVLTTDEPQRNENICGVIDCDVQLRDTWTRVQDAAERAYDRTAACSFTSFVGYEWTGAPGLSNLHRNVIFRGATVPETPATYFEAPGPWELWEALRTGCTDAGTGCDVLAIPHNSNLSNGKEFAAYGPVGQEADSAALRNVSEPLMEIFQHKGSSECAPGLGTVDEECAFESVYGTTPKDCGGGTGSGGMIGNGCTDAVDYLRGALLSGLAQEQALGVNPLELGVIASTDTHLGTPGLSTESADWPGHAGDPEDTPEKLLSDPPLRLLGVKTNPGGLAAVWAESNDRDAIFDALERRETYGTSGPRIALRFFGGWDYPESLCSSGELLEQAYAGGVPMGGRLPDGAEVGHGPRFVVQAMQDAEGRALEKVQVIKGWIDTDGVSHEQVLDVAVADSDMSVDEDTCEPAGEGAATMCSVWEDNDFDPSAPAFYYARALEGPTCRWSRQLCLELPEDARPEACDNPDVPRTIRERAWSSPIWFTP
ncbi:MAG: DUF3604 domain-containing protein [Proteobacteria bacterium]|nr:DUF3604 domain-containing protein [Pseudomonadota bacterium]